MVALMDGLSSRAACLCRQCYEPLEKALRRGQKTKLSRRLHEACPFLFLDDKLDAHLQHMRNLPQHDRALMQKQVGSSST